MNTAANQLLGLIIILILIGATMAASAIIGSASRREEWRKLPSDRTKLDWPES